MGTEYVFDPSPQGSVGVEDSDQRFPVRRIFCVGRNYAAHAREMGESDREPPFFFTKPGDSVIQSSLVPWPSQTSNLHHEVELVVAIGSKGRDITSDAALDLVFGYAVGVDLTRRDLQAEAKKQSRPWDVAKGFDASAPISDITPVVQSGHQESGRIFLEVDGDVRQDGDIGNMIWPVPGVISQLSKFFQLCPGDLVFTGTPEGVGQLLPGQNVRCGIDGLQALSFTMGESRV